MHLSLPGSLFFTRSNDGRENPRSREIPEKTLSGFSPIARFLTGRLQGLPHGGRRTGLPPGQSPKV
ncbi:hypothetical protein GCM10010485_52460 [Streptosporangium carneum]